MEIERSQEDNFGTGSSVLTAVSPSLRGLCGQVLPREDFAARSIPQPDRNRDLLCRVGVGASIDFGVARTQSRPSGVNSANLKSEFGITAIAKEELTGRPNRVRPATV